MLSLLILFILLIAFFSGASRGFALQGIYLVGYFVSFLAKTNLLQNISQSSAIIYSLSCGNSQF